MLMIILKNFLHIFFLVCVSLCAHTHMHIVVCTERSEDHFWDRFSSSTMWAPGQEGDGFLFLHVAHRKEGTSEVAGLWQALQLHVHLLGDVIWEAVFRAWWPLEAFSGYPASSLVKPRPREGSKALAEACWASATSF